VHRDVFVARQIVEVSGKNQSEVILGSSAAPRI
jgi:hypothetical protein